MNCDGIGPHSAGEIRILPLATIANALLCHACYNREISWRKERNNRLLESMKIQLPPWESLAVYQEKEWFMSDFNNLNNGTETIEAQAVTVEEDEAPARGELHAFLLVCNKATQSELAGERYQSARFRSEESGLPMEVEVSYLPPGAPISFGRRYRVTIEELP